MSTMLPRLHSVRFKDGRAPLRVLHRPAKSAEHDELLEAAGRFADRFPNMAGYIVIAWDEKGTTMTDCGTKGSPVPLLLLSALAQSSVADFVSAYLNGRELDVNLPDPA